MWLKYDHPLKRSHLVIHEKYITLHYLERGKDDLTDLPNFPFQIKILFTRIYLVERAAIPKMFGLCFCPAAEIGDGHKIKRRQPRDIGGIGF